MQVPLSQTCPPVHGVAQESALQVPQVAPSRPVQIELLHCASRVHAVPGVSVPHLEIARPQCAESQLPAFMACAHRESSVASR
jgi:hypothetical protein